MSRAKRAKKKASYIAVYIGLFFVFIILGAVIFPTDPETNTTKISGWYMFITLAVPAAAVFAIDRIQKKRDGQIGGLISSIHYEATAANKSRTIHDFLAHYDRMMEKLEQAKALDGKVTVTNGNVAPDYWRLKNEFQKHLHDAIDRSGDEVIKESKGLYKYDRDHVRESVLRYRTDIDLCKDRADAATVAFAEAKYRYVCGECKMLDLATHTFPTASAGQRPSHEVSEIKETDGMDGHDFEYWCADLLRQVGYQNVEVTRGSGDQGVDITAEKGGVHYAVQCKCYASPLGNTPVQEVFAGKEMYGCQVAVVMTNSTFTDGARELAKKTRVLLWDRGSLAEMLNAAKV